MVEKQLKNMEDELETKIEKQSQLVPALGLLGLGLGVVATALGIISMVKVGDTAADMNDKIEKAAALSLETKKISDRIDSLAMQIEEIKAGDKSRYDSLISQLNAELKRMGASIENVAKSSQNNRDLIEELAKRSSKRTTQAEPAQNRQQAARQAPERTAAAEQPAQQTQTAEQPAQNGESKKYKIQSGDTFAKLAKKHGVSLDAIIAANPDANPSRLKVGQEINIPAK
mgnify:CR=1 FL=1